MYGSHARPCQPLGAHLAPRSSDWRTGTQPHSQANYRGDRVRASRACRRSHRGVCHAASMTCPVISNFSIAARLTVLGTMATAEGRTPYRSYPIVEGNDGAEPCRAVL